MKLRTPSYLVLGMVRLGAKSGYAIKKATDISTRVFFRTSLAQVYPELGRLDAANLLTRREDPHGERSRSAYELTAKGDEALLGWLRSDRFADTQLRDEGLLRLFLADALPHEEQVVLVRRMRGGSWMASSKIMAIIRRCTVTSLSMSPALMRSQNSATWSPT